MAEQQELNLHYLGKGQKVEWYGQIASEASWADNSQGKPSKQNNVDQRGFGERYRVAIQGRHPQDLSEIKDEDLPWAYVEYPVTAGGGGRGSGQSANLTQGTTVKGYFADGTDEQLPIIVSVVGFNDWNAILKYPPTDKRYQSFSGFLEDEKISPYLVKAFPGGLTATPDYWSGAAINMNWSESMQASNTIIDMASWDAAEEGKKKEPLAETEECKPMPMGKIQKEIQNAINDIQKLQKSLYDFRYAISAETADIQKKINDKIQEVSKKVASLFKDILNQIQKGITNKVNKALKKVYFLLFPSDRPKLKKQVETVNDLIACLFKNLIKGLLGMVANFIIGAAKKIVNAAECFITNSLGQMLGQMLSGIQNAISGIMGGVNALVGSVVGVGDIVANVVKDLLSFLSCETQNECQEVNEWSIWSGPKSTNIGDILQVLNVANDVASTVSNTISSTGAALGQIIDPVVNIGDVFASGASACFTGPQACGPPTIDFIGKGKGALGNLIVSSAGSVIGYDPVAFGLGYDLFSSAHVEDACGNGSGAVVTPVLNDEGGIIDLIINQGGTGYLPTPNGSTGGNGRVWATPNDTEISHPNGDLEVPIPPDYVVEVQPGDLVNTPCGTEVVTEPIDNDPTTGGETIQGCSNHVVQRPGRFTTPRPIYTRNQGNYPTSGDGSYPVILYLCEVIIEDAGINYQPGDQVIIEPANGATAEAQFDAMGRVLSVKVTESGEGFIELPKIYIRSDTGFNASLLPKFCVDRVGEDEVKTPELQDKIVTVVDCVGKF